MSTHRFQPQKLHGYHRCMTVNYTDILRLNLDALEEDSNEEDEVLSIIENIPGAQRAYLVSEGTLRTLPGEPNTIENFEGIFFSSQKQNYKIWVCGKKLYYFLTPRCLRIWQKVIQVYCETLYEICHRDYEGKNLFLENGLREEVKEPTFFLRYTRITLSAFSRYLRSQFFLAKDLILKQTINLLEPKDSPKSAVQYKPGSHTTSWQFDLNHAYLQFLEKLGILQGDLFPDPESEVRITLAGRQEVPVGGLKLVPSLSIEPMKETYWKLIQKLHRQKGFRLLDLGTALMGAGGDSQLRLSYCDKGGGVINKHAHFRRQPFGFHFNANLLGRAAVKELGWFIFAVLPGTQMTLTDSYITTEPEVLEWLLHHWGIEYKPVAAGETEIVRPNVYRIGKKYTEHFEELKALFPDGEDEKAEEPVPLMFRALPLCLHKPFTVFADELLAIENSL